MARDGRSHRECAVRRKRVRDTVIFVSVGTHEAPFDRLLAHDLRVEARRTARCPIRPINDSRSDEALKSGVPVIRRKSSSYIRAVTRRRYARRRRLRDGLARQRQAADRDGSAAPIRRARGRSPTRARATAWRRPALVTAVEDAQAPRRRCLTRSARPPALRFRQSRGSAPRSAPISRPGSASRRRAPEWTLSAST